MWRSSNSADVEVAQVQYIEEWCSCQVGSCLRTVRCATDPVLQQRDCQSSCGLDTSVSSHRESTTPPLLPRATVIVSVLRRHDRANPLRDWRGVQLARRGANGLMKIGLRLVFMTSAMLVMAVPIEQFPDNHQLTLWSSCSTTIALLWFTPSVNRIETTECWKVFQWQL